MSISHQKRTTFLRNKETPLVRRWIFSIFKNYPPQLLDFSCSEILIQPSADVIIMGHPKNRVEYSEMLAGLLPHTRFGFHRNILDTPTKTKIMFLIRYVLVTPLPIPTIPFVDTLPSRNSLFNFQGNIMM